MREDFKDWVGVDVWLDSLKRSNFAGGEYGVTTPYFNANE